MTININGNTLDALSSAYLAISSPTLCTSLADSSELLRPPARPVIVERSQADGIARHWCAKLRDLLPRQQFEQKVQAMIGTKALASERYVPSALCSVSVSTD